ESDGFRDNNDIDTNIYTAYAQYELSPRASAQVELRRQDTEAGDLREFSNPAFVFENLRQSLDRDTARFGFRFSPDPNSDVLASLAYRELVRDTNDPNFTPTADFLLDFFRPSPPAALNPEDIAFLNSLAPLFPAGFNELIRTTNDVNSATFELEYLRSWERLNIALGGGFTQQERARTVFNNLTLSSPLAANLREELQQAGLPASLADPLIKGIDKFATSDLAGEDSDETHLNAYLYGTVRLLHNLHLTTGVAVNAIDRDSEQTATLDRKGTYVSPKVGAMWEPFASTRFRAGWFRAVARPSASNQTIEPTHVAGFNQVFDDAGGARFQRYGVAVDQKLPLHVDGGFEFTWRDVELPRFEFGGNPRASLISQEETAHRAYLYWTPTQRVTLAAQYFYEELERGPLTSLENGTPRSALLHRVPLSLGYYDPNGFFTRLTATYVNQDVDVRDDNVPLGTSEASDRFWSTDVVLGYRLPKRLGIVTFGVINLFDEGLRFQDASPNVIGDIEGEFVPPEFLPERVLFGQVTLAF
ncbi:MAG: TonB-dependent receptor domain-containing protein, partial [Gammaproteobacteria bacterium]